MKKIAILALILCASQAQANEKLCAAVAEASVTAKKLAEMGEPYRKVIAPFQVKGADHLGMREIVVDLITHAFYTYPGVPDTTARSLAYTNCMVKMP